MSLKLRLLLLICVLFGSIAGFSQDHLSPAYKKRLYDANLLFDEGNYLRALDIYDSLWTEHPNEVYLQYRVGICHIYKSNGREKAYNLLKELEGKVEYKDLTFYLARAKHLDYHFKEAINLYTDYLEKSKASGSQRINTLQYIDNCMSGIELMERKMALSLEILTPPSNPTNSQYSPVISPDEKQLYYTNRGPESKGDLMDDKSKKTDIGSYYEDVFVANATGDGNFENGHSLSDNVNQAGRHEAPMSISYDNNMLFIYMSGNKQEEDIYVSNRIGDTLWTSPEKVRGEVNTPHWEGHACLAPDGKTLYFASDRPGGIGARDIYTATVREDGSYGNVQNLGPKINTAFNEDAPFMYSNGSSLYFSSEAHGSMGGYDMFYAKYDSTKAEWQEAVNLGYPINTTDDDRFYYITKDGSWGYFSSARASGENLHDIYRIKPGTFERLNALVLLVGTVYIDDVPSSCLVKIMDDNTGDVMATLVADSTTGEFVYSLLPDKKYKISLLADGFPPKVEFVDVPPLAQGVMRIEHRFDFYSLTYLALKSDSAKMGLQDALDSELRFKAGGEDGDGFTYSGLDHLDIDPSRENLTDTELKAGFRFRVQVGAYRNPGRFKYAFLRSLGEVDIIGCDDKITRYLMGQKFTTRSEAEILRQKCVDAGQWDAWITVRR